MKAFIDQAGEVREKEKLPERELEIYIKKQIPDLEGTLNICLLYTSPSPRDRTRSRMPSSA